MTQGLCVPGTRWQGAVGWHLGGLGTGWREGEVAQGTVWYDDKRHGDRIAWGWDLPGMGWDGVGTGWHRDRLT